MSYSPIISKSAFTRGLQCDKSLYLKKKHPELEDAITATQQAIFDSGTNIGELATELFPGGMNLGALIPERMNEVFAETPRLMANKKIVYEGGFSFNRLICFSDIVVPSGNQWKVYEVKGSTEVKEVYLWDAAFQYYVITQSGVKVEDISIIHVNNQYERVGALELEKLFKIVSVKAQVLDLQVEVDAQVKRFKALLTGSQIPNIGIGPHCTDPYSCSFMGHCWKHVPDYSVFNISRLGSDKKFGLYEQGILEISDVSDEFPLSASQRIQVEGEKDGAVHIDKEAIHAFVDGLNYPLFFLDFETFNPAVPLFDYSRPYQQIVFQYSLHILNKPYGELVHKEFLADAIEDLDPRIPFIEQLIQDVKSIGDIIVYNQAFESGRLKELAATFPDYGPAIERMLARIVDLMVPFSKKHYYTPEMKGSYSIKKVLPALVPGFSYTDLNINEGGAASAAFYRLYWEKDKAVAAQIREDLLEYCGLDTMAMVEVLRVLDGIG